MLLTTMHRYPIYVNIWKRDIMDSHRDTKVGLEPLAPGDKTLQLEAQPSRVEKEHAEGISEVPGTKS